MKQNIRLKIFEKLLKPISKRSRKKRTAFFRQALNLKVGMKVLDVGGLPNTWDTIEIPLEITFINLPGTIDTKHDSHHNLSFVFGDACSMPEFQTGDFDMVFSNSVIEHVGNKSRRKLFASEIRRISEAYWIQTPHILFPVEAHCGMPFWWLYPNALRRLLTKKWKRNLPEWATMIEETDVLHASELRDLFPGAQIKTEWLIFPKSLVAYATVRT